MMTTEIKKPTIEEMNRVLAEYMGFPKITIGSKWNYDRSLDNADNTRNLEVINIDGNQVYFDMKMPFKSYGKKYFDGRTFYPVGTKGWTKDDNPYPRNAYHKSWDSLMPVIKKILSIEPATPLEEMSDKELHKWHEKTDDIRTELWHLDGIEIIHDEGYNFLIKQHNKN